MISSLIILILGLLKGTRKYTLLDGACQFLAIGGIVFWRISHDPNVALAFAILVDILAVIPTHIHSWHYPGEEPWSTFAIAAAAAFVFILLAPTHTFAALAIPIDLFVANGMVAALIVSRRNMLKQEQTS